MSKMAEIERTSDRTGKADERPLCRAPTTVVESEHNSRRRPCEKACDETHLTAVSVTCSSPTLMCGRGVCHRAETTGYHLARSATVIGCHSHAYWQASARLQLLCWFVLVFVHPWV